MDVIAFDIGNSLTKFVLYGDNGDIIKRYQVSSCPLDLHMLYQHIIDNALVEDFQKKTIIIASVKPENNDILLDFLQNNLLCKNIHFLNIVGDDFLLKNSQDSIASVGLDILCKCAFAVHYEKDDCLIIDLGTATVVQYINNSFLQGVSISCGLNSMVKGLSNDTALLPEIEPNYEKHMFAMNTIDCLKGGIFYGYLGLVLGLLEQSIKETECRNIILTGGFSHLFKKHLPQCSHRPNLVFEGIFAIYKLNKVNYTESEA